MPKILSELKKKEMLYAFKNGNSLEDLEVKYELKKVTIAKHLKSLIDSAEFMKIAKLNSSKNDKNSLSDKKSNNKPYDIDKLENKNQSKFIASNYE